MRFVFACLLILIPSLCFADSPQELARKGRLLCKAKFISAESGKSGQYRIVRFRIPENRLLVALEVSERHLKPLDGNTFKGSALRGWRITRLDKLSVYHSDYHPETQFTIEAWARRTKDQDSAIRLWVQYCYVDILKMSREDFNQTVQLTLDNIHPIPVHDTAQEVYTQSLMGKGDLVREHVLRKNEDCKWGANPDCRDCMLRLRSSGKTYQMYFYNSNKEDGVCF